MSVEVMTWVFKHSEVNIPGWRLVLLSMADRADPDGTKVFPSVERLAGDTRMSERGVRYALRKLEEHGAIKRIGVNAEHNYTNEYAVLMTEEARGARSAPRKRAAKQGGKEQQKQGASVAPEPSLEPSKGNRPPAASARTREALPDDFPSSMREPLAEVVEILGRIAAARNVKPPVEAQLARAMMKRPLKPWVRVAEDLEDWLVYGKGQRASAATIAQRWRTWLDGEEDVQPGGTVTHIRPHRQTNGSTGWTAREMYELGQQMEEES